MKKTLSFVRLLAVILSLGVALAASAQSPAATVELWEGTNPPTDNGLTGDEVNHGLYITNITKPTLTVYVPEEPCGKAVIACPGGAYGGVWVGTEGHNLAQWFLSQGITFAVLKYRLPNGHATVPSEDLARAITIMRHRAKEWGDFTTLGVMGSSAGGHLAATAATKFTDEQTRPDFQILCYPVASLQDGLTHYGTLNSLLGSSRTQEQVNEYSPELQATELTPRAFIMHAADDKTVTPCSSTAYADALMKKGVPVSLHIYPTGDHGCSTTDEWIYTDEYRKELGRFIEDVPLRPRIIDDDEKRAFFLDSIDGRIYALNNLDVYEPYGIYEKVKVLKVAEPRPAEIEYIETTADMYDQAHAAYINTGYTHTPNTRIVMECAITSNRNFSALFGSRKAYATNEFAFFSHFKYSGWTRENGAFGTSDGEMNLTKVVPTGEKIRIDANAKTKRLTIYKDGETKAYVTKVSTKGVAAGVCPLYIFNLNSNGTLDTSPAYMRLYSFQIYEDDTLVRDYVPVVTANGAGGLKDRLTGQILTSANDVPFRVSPDAGSTVYEGKLFLNETDHKEYCYTGGEFVEVGSYLKSVPSIGTDYSNLSNWTYDPAYESTYQGIATDGSNRVSPYRGQGGWEPLWYKLQGLTVGTDYNLSFRYNCSLWWSWMNASFMPFSILNNENFTRSNGLWPEGGNDGVIAWAPLQEGATTDQLVSIDFKAQQDYQMLVLQFGYAEDATDFSFQFADLAVMEYDIPKAYLTSIDDIITDIEAPKDLKDALGYWYSLDGKRMNTPSKEGIYIKDGKKVVVK
ncbi:MAG: alpha/beta hydrolase [Bacteroidaceae bacterium]|nr:alpha/beta hydrolase [Bacteroidaceae bacterium]MBQ9169218.1 alpha/beta hydrolase [Bacteroidaceae bacterium]